MLPRAAAGQAEAHEDREHDDASARRTGKSARNGAKRVRRVWLAGTPSRRARWADQAEEEDEESENDALDSDEDEEYYF